MGRDFSTGTVRAGGAGNARRAAAALSDAAARKALLLCADPSASLQDQLDCAELLDAVGLGGGAQQLRDAAWWPLGVFPVRGTAAGAGRALAGPAAGQGPTPSSPSSVAAAIAQFRSLVVGVRDLPPLLRDGCSIAGEAPVTGALTGAHPACEEQDHADSGPAASIDLFEHLRAALQQPLDPPADMSAATAEPGRLDAVLARLQADVLDAPAFEARRHVGADLSLLCAGVVADRLRSFFAGVSDLAYAPFGSPGLFHAAARLDAGGLGPWFANVPRVVRGARDVFALVQLAAAPDGSADDDALERWSFLLSQHMPDAMLQELVDELADMGLMRAVRGILERRARRPDLRQADLLLRRVRDAGLDEGDLDLALQAQRLVVEGKPAEALEWIALGEVEATAGNRAAAEEAFAAGLRLDPTNGNAARFLEALREGWPEEYWVGSGFGTPLGRKRLRRLRRAMGQLQVRQPPPPQ